MDKPTVYLETSVISYATARISRDVVTAARQQVTAEWFALRASDYNVYVSQVVLDEAAAGDPAAAAARLARCVGYPRLDVTEAAIELATWIVRQASIPTHAGDDAVHLAVAAAHGLDYLLTWNFRHIANPALERVIGRCCRDAGFEPPVICTPEELSAEEPNG